MKTLLLVTIATLGLTASTMAQNLPNYVPANGLVGWWPFTGNANDESGNGHNGTANGAALTSDRFGNAEKAYGFDGLNDNIIIPHNENLNSYPLTINIWLKSNGDIDGGILITKYCCSNWQGWDIQVSPAYEDTAVFTREYLRGGCLGLFQWYCGEQQQQKHTAFDEVWHMYTFRIDSFGASIFWDGIQVGSQEWIGQPGPINNILDLCIGSYYTEGGFYTGLLDDIGIWNRSLTQQEISDLFNAVDCSNNLTIIPITNQLATGGTALFNATTTDASPSYLWQSDFGQGVQTLNNYGNYSGVNTNSLSISNVQLQNHNQPIRVISTSGECIDTSDVAYISIIDTCINNINDTTLISVTDTLIINTNISSINSPNNSNTIKVFPNPANSHITIDYGNFVIMNGYELKIENSLGQQLFQTNITQQTDYLSLNNWGGNGIYFVHIIDAQGNTIDIRKIVLQ